MPAKSSGPVLALTLHFVSQERLVYIPAKKSTDDSIPALMLNEMSSKESRRNWAGLIRKIYEVDPLICPKCWGHISGSC